MRTASKLNLTTVLSAAALTVMPPTAHADCPNGSCYGSGFYSCVAEWCKVEDQFLHIDETQLCGIESGCELWQCSHYILGYFCNLICAVDNFVVCMT